MWFLRPVLQSYDQNTSNTSGKPALKPWPQTLFQHSAASIASNYIIPPADLRAHSAPTQSTVVLTVSQFAHTQM